MRAFLRFVATLVTLLIIAVSVYYLARINREYKESHPIVDSYTEAESSNKVVEPITKVEDNKTEDKDPNTFSQEEKESILNGIRSIVNLNIMANVRKNEKISFTKEQYNPILYLNQEIKSGDESGEELVTEDFPDSIDCNLQVAGSMAYITPQDSKYDSFQFHYSEDGNLVAYIREYANTNVKASYYFEHDEYLDYSINSLDRNYDIREDDKEILKRAKEIYSKYFLENN